MLFGEKVPVPPLQIPVVVVPETIPDKAVAALFLQDERSRPALTVGALLKIINN